MTTPTGFTDIQMLVANNNKMVAFPDVTSINETLRWLKLGSNDISYIDAALLEPLTLLINLQLWGNLLTSIPDVAGPGSNLVDLNLKNNPISVTPSLRFIGVSSKILHLEQCDLSDVIIPDQDTLPVIRRLFLQKNDLTAFPDLTYIGDTVRDLYLSGNLITVVPRARLEVLKVIQRLDLRQNRLTSYPDVTPIIPSLSLLELNYNDLSNDGLYAFFTKLTNPDLNLHLAGTEVTTVPSTVCSGQPLASLNLLNTGLVCDCRLRWLKGATLSGHMVTMATKPCVGGPNSVVDKEWSDLAIKDLQCEGEKLRI